MSVSRAAAVLHSLRKEVRSMGIEMYILAFLVIATGYLMTIRGNDEKK